MKTKEEASGPIEQSGSVPLQGGVVPYLRPEVAEIHSKRVQKIIADIDFMRSREDCIQAQDEFDKAIDHLRNAIERIKA